jgi:nucleoside-diphosphate-sugar epimerase
MAARGVTGLFVFGLGTSAGTFARSMLAGGAKVSGTVRSEEKAESLRAEGIAAIVFDGAGPFKDVTAALGEATHLVLSIPPGESGDPALRFHANDILAAQNLEWIGYLSTIGVYGDYAGAWVSERTTPHPRPGRSQHRLEAEKAWRALAEKRGLPLAILRLAGIYGPSSNALKNLAEGKARRIVKEGQVFNRIHVEDIVAMLHAALEKKADGIFNVCDDEPAPPQDVVEFAAKLMGAPVPPAIDFDSADLTPMARSFYGENKRVLNRRIRQELGVTLAHPTYREGLGSLWSSGRWS